jgi:amidohydrolase
MVAVRADMDALPVTEQTDLPFRSTVRTTWNNSEVGVMHACGHDVHTSVLMGVASVLADLGDELPGSVLFIFQPAEEGAPAGETGGARLMLEEGLFGEVDPVAIFALHIDPQVPVGDVVYSVGPALAASDGFSITVTGRQTHAARPHTGIDPIVMASQIVLALQTITSRTLDPLDSCVVTVGMFHGGERSNIIPENVQLNGTVRSYSDEVRDTVERRMQEIVEGITGAGGGSGRLRYSRGLPPTINDPGLVRSMLPSLQAALGAEHVIEGPPWMASEDFAYYSRLVPGFIFMLGTLKEGTLSGDLHNPTMRADDSAIPVGIRALSNLIIDRLTMGSGEGRD